MGYIYKITNLINQKSYIGQTRQDFHKRWQQHISDTNTNRGYLIHKAIAKYGLTNFTFSIIEECENTVLNDREKYWIKYYDSYNNGYNLTLGGKGYSKIDYDKVIFEYTNNNISCAALSKKLKISAHSIGQILAANNISHHENDTFIYGTECAKKPVKQLDKRTNHTIQEFSSQVEAAKYIKENNISKASIATIAGHIGEVCEGKGKSAYGYKWAR